MRPLPLLLAALLAALAAGCTPDWPRAPEPIAALPGLPSGWQTSEVRWLGLAIGWSRAVFTPRQGPDGPELEIVTEGQAGISPIFRLETHTRVLLDHRGVREYSRSYDENGRVGSATGIRRGETLELTIDAENTDEFRTVRLADFDRAGEELLNPAVMRELIPPEGEERRVRLLPLALEGPLVRTMVIRRLGTDEAGRALIAVEGLAVPARAAYEPDGRLAWSETELHGFTFRQYPKDSTLVPAAGGRPAGPD